ncbi:MAG: transposase [Anaerostipes hadrus]
MAFCDDRTSNGQKECLITNLPANKFPPETLKKLYCIRWKIETSFRLIKYSQLDRSIV